MGSALCNCLDTVPDWAVRFRPGCLPRIPLPSTRLGSRGRQAPHPPDISEATLTLTRQPITRDRKSTRLNSSHGYISYAVFCLKKKKKKNTNRSCSAVGILHTFNNTSAYEFPA